ncbi:MAG: PmeII family type II restriction endonuclease [Chloroflexota bacterium]|nr:PmeII family type II restriction endonuclease [Chloroflexota bacterium]
MNHLDLNEVCEYVNKRIVSFHEKRFAALTGLELKSLLKKNPYLFKAKNVETANELIEGFLTARLSSAEEKFFGDFLEDLAIFIAGKTSGGHKSAAPGVDLEFIEGGIHYIVSIKSGPNWGNSDQQNKLEQNLRDAVTRVKQSQFGANAQAVLGICYGKTRTNFLRGYLKVVGQNFWTLISGNQDLYTEIIEPIGYRAEEHNTLFKKRKNGLHNKLSVQFVQEFCDSSTGMIDWVRLVEYNSGNYDLDKLLAVNPEN